MSIGIYIEPLFATKSAMGNYIEIAKSTDEDQVLVGIIIYGEHRKVSNALDGLKFHP